MIVTCPYLVSKNKKETVSLSVNNSCLNNVHVKRSAKAEVREFMCDQDYQKLVGPVFVFYQVFKPSDRACDTMNFVTYASKWCLDILTERGVWVDDNDNIIRGQYLIPAVLDRDNPRIEIDIYELNSEGGPTDPLKIAILEAARSILQS